MSLTIRPDFAPLLAHLRFTLDFPFTNPAIQVWRKLSDRENCTFDARWPDGRPVRLHIKRYPASSAQSAADEARGLELLEQNQIPCPRLIAWGHHRDGRSFLATEDLAGFAPADKLISAGTPFSDLLAPTAELAARLHTAGLHHRDLYLCHFFCKSSEVKLIDAARVRPLPGALTRRRWIVKDLAQFWYSMTQLPITPDQQSLWLTTYAAAAGARNVPAIHRSILGKSRRIGAHDAKLNQRQPTRNISIPE